MGLAPALDAIAPAYRGIKVPVTIVVGGEDASALANNRRLAENLTQAKYVELPGIGHEIPHLRARRVADEVRALLGR
jgi:pimeloyl-ACP methyl ester carboxylesterase